MWDVSPHDKKSWTYTSRVGEHAIPSTTRAAGTASKNGAAKIPIIPASTGSPTLNPSSAIGEASAGAACRV